MHGSPDCTTTFGALQLHLQGESIDAIVRQTGHARTTVLRWVRRFTADGSLLDRTRSGRPLRVMTHCGRSDQTIGESQTRPSESINASDRCHAELSRDSHSKGVKPYVQPQVPLQRYGDKQRRLRFAAEQKERDWRCCVFADKKTFV